MSSWDSRVSQAKAGLSYFGGSANASNAKRCMDDMLVEIKRLQARIRESAPESIGEKKPEPKFIRTVRDGVEFYIMDRKASK